MSVWGIAKRPRLLLMASVWSVSCAQTDQSSFTFFSLGPWLNCPAKFDGGVGGSEGRPDESDTPSGGRQNLISKLLAIKVDFSQIISNQKLFFFLNFNQVIHCGNENVYCSIIEWNATLTSFWKKLNLAAVVHGAAIEKFIGSLILKKPQQMSAPAKKKKRWWIEFISICRWRVILEMIFH